MHLSVTWTGKVPIGAYKKKIMLVYRGEYCSQPKEISLSGSFFSFYDSNLYLKFKQKCKYRRIDQ